VPLVLALALDTSTSRYTVKVRSLGFRGVPKDGNGVRPVGYRGGASLCISLSNLIVLNGGGAKEARRCSL